MKKTKLISVLALSAFGACCLASCNSIEAKKMNPGVLLYARSAEFDDIEMKWINIGKFVDDQCVEFTVENAENLKYGEQDVVVHITPKMFFRLSKKYDPESWESKGDYCIPYVGLGSPYSKFNYELPYNVAWTYEPELLDGSSRESYKLTVKKDYFQKNIVIGYGYARSDNSVEHQPDNYALPIKSDFYKEKIITQPFNAPYTGFKYPNYEDKTKSGKSYSFLQVNEGLGNNDATDVQYNEKSSTFYVSDDGLHLVYNTGAGIQDEKSNQNNLFTFAGLDATTDADGGKKVFKNLQVNGIKIKEPTPVENGDGDEPKYTSTLLSEITTSEIQTNKYQFEVNVNSSGRQADIFIDWFKLADPKTYNQLYDFIEVRISHLNKLKINEPTVENGITIVDYGTSLDKVVGEVANPVFYRDYYSCQTNGNVKVYEEVKGEDGTVIEHQYVTYTANDKTDGSGQTKDWFAVFKTAKTLENLNPSISLKLGSNIHTLEFEAVKITDGAETPKTTAYYLEDTHGANWHITELDNEATEGEHLYVIYPSSHGDSNLNAFRYGGVLADEVTVKLA